MGTKTTFEGRGFFLTLTVCLVTSLAQAQTGGGSLRGYVKDTSGAVLPGVRITATSDVLMAPEVTVTTGLGAYRLVNLPHGVYTLIAELDGFGTYRREGIQLLAGANFSVDITLSVGGFEEAVTVTGETPMLEVTSPGSVLNIDGELQRNLPLQARRNWSDFVELLPGMSIRPFDDGSGRMVYFGHGAEHFSHVVMLEGMNINGFFDAQLTYVGTAADTLDDIQVKTGGIDASEPTGTGLVINVVTKRGGNDFSGAAGYSFQPIRWNADNAPIAGNFAGTPTLQQVNQLDASLGGPIVRDDVWFFGTYRYAALENGINRSPEDVRLLSELSGATLGEGRGVIPEFEPFNNTSNSHQPYLKVTARLDPSHQLSGYFQKDRTERWLATENDWELRGLFAEGGSAFGAKLDSVFSSDFTAQFSATYNNKSGTTEDVLEGGLVPMPDITVYQNVVEDFGVLFGDVIVGRGGNRQTTSIRPSSMLILRGDLTFYTERWGGSHELKTGVFAAPRLHYDRFTRYANDGFAREERRLIDPSDPSRGTVPFHRLFWEPSMLQTVHARERDIAWYVQDSWKPTERLTLNLGARADFVRRHDGLFDLERMNTVALGPRLGFSYMLTEDARAVLRGSWSRLHEQVNGRDAITTTGLGGRASVREVYDVDGDGTFETEFFHPAVSPTVGEAEFDPDIGQPYVDEWILGVRKQLPRQISLDIAFVNRRYEERYAQVDVNGFYPENPGEPFLGFGAIDPERAKILQLTNNTWDALVYRALEVSVTQRLSESFLLVAALHRQWQRFDGEYNPTDPARFIEPDAYASNRLLSAPRGTRDDNSLARGGTNTYGPMWRDYAIRLGATWRAPAGIVLAASLSHQAGPWTGAILNLLDANDPDIARFGPPFFFSPEGNRLFNPLSTRIRYEFPTRGEGQVKAPDITTLGVKFGKTFSLGETQQLEIAGNVFNVPNLADFHQYTYNGANEIWSPRYLQMRSLQAPRSFQLTARYRF